jgi:hypothetical protein
MASIKMSEKPEEDPEPPIDKPDPTDPVKVTSRRVFGFELLQQLM